MSRSLGFVGLGVMGEPMAGHLLQAGANLTVWNRTASKGERLASAGAKVASDLAHVARECDVIFLCVSRTEDVRECLAELSQSARQNALFVDHSTIAPSSAAEIHESLKACGLRFVDAPITGGSMGAQKGQLTIFCGGEEADVAEAIEVSRPYTKRAERVGGPGAGQRMKMANQIAVGGSLLALCESLSFAVKAGLDLRQAKEMIGGGGGGSFAFENYGPKILARDWSPGFSITNQRKDFGYCREDAESLDAAIPGTLLVDRLLAKLDEEGRGADTTAALFDVLMEMHAE